MDTPYTDPEKQKLKRARKRVRELKGFYVHLMIYLIVNAFIIAMLVVAGSREGEYVWSWYNLTTAVFWGIGLLIHAAMVFRLNPFFSKSWEERMIRKFMDEDRARAEKHKHQS